MASARGPPKEPVTPSRYPERDVVSEYREMYRRLQDEGYRRMESLRQISEAFGGVSVSLLRKFIPSSRAFFDPKKHDATYWRIRQAKNPEGLRSYNTKRRAAARHLDDHIRTIYNSSDRDELTIQELSDALAENTGIKFQPATILRYDKKHAKKNGQNLLDLVEASNPPRYRLSDRQRYGK